MTSAGVCVPVDTPDDPHHIALPDYKPPHPGDWIRRQREELGFTRHRLAVVAEVDLVALKRIETRALWTLNVETARRLGAVLGELAPEHAATAPRL